MTEKELREYKGTSDKVKQKVLDVAHAIVERNKVPLEVAIRSTLNAYIYPNRVN